jgi:hypothetical protein
MRRDDLEPPPPETRFPKDPKEKQEGMDSLSIGRDGETDRLQATASGVTESPMELTISPTDQEGQAVADVSLPGELADSAAFELPDEAHLVGPELTFELETEGGFGPVPPIDVGLDPPIDLGPVPLVDQGPIPPVDVGPEPPFPAYGYDLPPLAPPDPFGMPDRPFGLDAFDDFDYFDPFGGDPFSGDPFAGW